MTGSSPPKVRRRRAKTPRMARPKIPDRAEFTARVPAALLAKVDAAVRGRMEVAPSFTRTDALVEALAAWVAAEAAKGGAQ